MSADVNREFVRGKCDYFVDVHVWPLTTELQPEPWLSNFLDSEMNHALHLLNSFLFFSEPLVSAMFTAAFQTLSSRYRAANDLFLTSQARWRDFVDSVRITYVTGEHPNPSDSGFLFARKARKLLDIDEARIQSPEQTASELVASGPWPVVFVDDFVGTGNQFVRTWRRPMNVAPGRTVTFEQLSTIRGQTFAYCPLISCQLGYDAIRRECPQVSLNCCHVFPPDYSAVAPDSVLWPPALLPNASSFIQSASARAGIPDTGGIVVKDWKGFGNLGLALAFAHSVPDATLPIFYWEQNGWKPLVRRT
jgi:hypothetical protein